MGRDFSPFTSSLDWRPCSAELTPEGQQCTRVPAGSLQLVTVTVTVMVTVTVLPTPRAQPRAARLGTGLECWPCDQHRLCACSYKRIWAPGSARWAAQCSASLLSYLLKSFRTHVNPPANAPGRRPSVYSCAWWLRPAARPVRREVPVHEGLGGRAAGLPSVGTGKGELLYKPAAAHFGRHFGPALQLRPMLFC